MAEFQDAISIRAPADRIFKFLVDLNNLPKVFPTLRTVRRTEGEKIRVQGDTGNRTYDQEGFLRLESEHRRLDWGSGGERDYSGWMVVRDDGPNDSEVVCNLHFGEDTRIGEIDNQRVENELRTALERLRDQVEGRRAGVGAS